MKTVILTGYAGFIGSQILRDLLLKNYNVIGIDNMSEGSDPENYQDFVSNPRFLPILTDLCNPHLSAVLEDILDSQNLTKVDYIINCAADSHVDRSWDQVNKFIDSNIKGPINLAMWALKTGVEKFVQVSTDEVWGGAAQPYNENSIFAPENIYSTSKCSAEMFLQNLKKAYNLPLIITNGANTYGKRQMVEKIIPKTIYNISNYIKVPLYKTPARRMWLHVEDHSQGIILAMEKGVVGEKYCLAPELDQELFTEDLVKMICSHMGEDFEDVVSYVPDRLNYDLRYYMDNSKAKAELGFNPSHKISEELPGVITWFLDKYCETT